MKNKQKTKEEIKKEKEIITLKRFISLYNETINKNTKFEILDIDRVKLKFPDYNGENPDFVLLINDKYVAIDFFRLVKDNIEPSNIKAEEKLNNPKNASHLYNQRRKRGDRSLYLMEKLDEVAIERINKKIPKKLDKYIKCPVWLIGYADEPYNLFLLTHYFEDKKENKVADYISKKIAYDNRVEKIWLVEFSGESKLLEIKKREG